MKKEWIRTDEERQLRELKLLRKQQKTDQGLKPIQIVERKKNRLRLYCSSVDPQRHAVRGEDLQQTEDRRLVLSSLVKTIRAAIFVG